jgi:hypothetical protein
MSITLEAGFGIEALEEVLTRFGKPTSSTRIREANLPASTSPASSARGDRHQHGWQGLLARQRVH